MTGVRFSFSEKSTIVSALTGVKKFPLVKKQRSRQKEVDAFYDTIIAKVKKL